MGTARKDFAEGTPAPWVFFPPLVLGWEALRPVLYRWGLTVPEVLDHRTTIQAVRALRGIDFGERIIAAKRKASLWDLTEAESAEALAVSWMILATWAGRYERRRRAQQPTDLEWIEASEALREFQVVLADHVPHLHREA